MDDLANIKIIKTIKHETTFENETFTTILYVIESSNDYIELWTTYKHYGSIELAFGIPIADYNKDPEHFELNALNYAITEYIEREF